MDSVRRQSVVPVLLQALRAAVPALVAIGALLYGALGFLLPFIESNLFAQRREMVKRLTEPVWSSLVSRHAEVEAGRLDLATAQRRSIERFRTIRYGEKGKDYYWIIDLTPRMIMHPYRPELEGQDLNDFVDPDGRLLFRTMAAVARESSGGGYVRYRWQWKDNPERIEPKISYVRCFKPWGWIVGTGVYVDDIYADLAVLRQRVLLVAAGVFTVTLLAVGFLAVQTYRSESERRRQEAALQRSERFNRRLIANAPEGIVLLLNDRIVDCNNQILSALGHAREAVLGKSPWDFSPPRQADGEASEGAARRQMAAIVGSGGIHQFEWQLVTRDGALLDTEIRMVAIQDSGAAHLLAFVRDITPRKAAEAQLREERDFSQTLIQKAASYILVSRPGEEVLLANPALLEALEWELDALLGKSWVEVLVAPADRERLRGALEERVAFPAGGGAADVACWMTGAAGAQRRVHWTLTCLHTDGRGAGSVLLIGLDVTEQQRLEEQMRHTQKMDVIGQLASGVAHDFNNHLGAILGAADLLEMQGSVAPAGARHLRLIQDTASRAAGLTERLLSFVRRDSLPESFVDLHQLLHATVDLLRSGLMPQVVLTLRLEAQHHVVRGDDRLLQNALFNLGINARDAMPEGGTLLLTTADAVLEEGNAACERLDLLPGQYVRVTVADTGSGMSPSTRRRIFEPFYTTKAEGQGTGLGLASTYSIVQEHGGSIQVESELGVGSEFALLLPCSQQPADTRGRSPAPSFQPCRVLVVDDEETVREMAAEYLRELGCHVDVCPDGASALQFYRGVAAAVDVVLLDLAMPGMNGREVFRALRRIRPDAAVVLTSGLASDEQVDELRAAGLAGFLAKPFSLSSLMGAVAAAAGGAAGSGDALPAAPPAVLEQVPDRIASAERRTGPRAVVVEDDRVIGELLKDVLGDRGYAVELFTTWEAAAAFLDTACCPLLIVDWHLPGGSGLDLCRQARERRGEEPCFIMMITGRGSHFAVQTALDSGVNDYLTKPFTMDLFAVRIDVAERHLENARKRLAAETALREVNRELENRVEERTASLQQKARELEQEIAHRAEVERELQEQRAQLAHADKLAALGVLVSSMAHEINNPNNFIAMNSGLLEEVWAQVAPALARYCAADGTERLGKYALTFILERVPCLVAGIGEGSERIARIIEELRGYARKDTAPYDELVDVVASLRKAEEMIGSRIRHCTTAYATAVPDGGVPPIRGQGQALEQVLINLILNACDALPEPGCALRVTVRHDREAGVVEVEVDDEGTGMAPEVRSRVLEPFYTTKGEGRGTGLGLSISQDIVKRHHGTMAIRSALGRGTTVVLRFPVAEKEPPRG